MNNSEQSVTDWFHALREGDEIAADGLWQRYFQRLSGFARQALATDPAYDGEDLAVSVFDALCKAAKDGRYPELAGRDELWRLLVTIANRKIVDRHRHLNAKRRTSANGGRMVPGVDLDKEVSGRDNPPDLAVELADECRHLLDQLDDETTRKVAMLKLDRFTNQEIADQLSIGERSVRRMIHIIRKTWTEHAPQVSE